jgi:hypothetical protein
MSGAMSRSPACGKSSSSTRQRSASDLLRREADGWPDDPLTLTDTVSLESLGFTAPVAAFYRTAGEASSDVSPPKPKQG